MINLLYGNSAFEAINSAYPNRFKPCGLNSTPKNYWTSERGIEATKWLVEEKLKLSPNCIKGNVTRNNFVENGLRGMLMTCFYRSYKKALKATYPELDL